MKRYCEREIFNSGNIIPRCSLFSSMVRENVHYNTDGLLFEC